MLEKPTKWKPVTDEVLKWETPGQTAEGIYADMQVREFSDRSAKLYTLNVDSGRTVRFWGSTILDQRLDRVPIGTWVQITYKGQAGQGNRRYKDFEVNVAESTKLLEESDVDSIP